MGDTLSSCHSARSSALQDENPYGGRLRQGDQKRWSTMSKRKSGSMLDNPKTMISAPEDIQPSPLFSRPGRPSNLDLLPPENPNAAHTVDLLPSFPSRSPQISSPESWTSQPGGDPSPSPSFSSANSNSNPPPKPPRLYVNTATAPLRKKRISGYFGNYENIPDLKSLQSTDVAPELSPMSRTYPRSSRYKAIESRDSRMLTDEFLFAQHRQILEIMRYLLIDRLNAPDVLHHLFRKGVITEQEKEIVLQEERKKTMNIFIVDELFTKGEAEFEAFKYILRLNEDHEALADILEVLETVFKTLEKHNPNKPLDPEVDSGTEADVDPLEEDPYELVGEVLRAHHSQPPALDAAHMHCDISYYDRETGEVLPIITLPTPPGYFPRLTSCDNPRASVALAREFTDMIEQNLQMDGCLTDSCESPEKYVPVISLDIYDQNLGDDGASVLASVLEKYGCVSELSIPKNCIDSDGMERLASALQVNKSLLKLDVRMNPMTNEAARAFSNALHKNTSLKSLNLTDTRISHDGCSDIVQNLVGNGTLRELDLGFNELDDGDCDHIAQLLGNRSALKKLRLRGNNIAFLGCRALSRSLERNTGLLVLDLSSNDIGDNAAFHIGTMLSRNTTLQFLNLEKCGFTKEAAGAIAQSLTENKTLLSLDLGMNHLGDSGAEALAAMLSHNSSLKTLCLNMCGIGKQGFLGLLEALDNNTCLSTLKLCFNEIGRSERRAPMSQLHPHDGGIQGNSAILDLVYDRLHSTLVYKRDLKLLLWGNKLDEKRYSKEVRFEKCRLRQGDQKRWSTMSKRKSGSMLDNPKTMISAPDDIQPSPLFSRPGRPSNLDLLPPENPNAAHTVDLLPSFPSRSPQISSPESWTSQPGGDPSPSPSFSSATSNSNPPPKPPRLYVNTATAPLRKKRISGYFGNYENIPDLKSLQSTDVAPELSPMSRTYPRSSRYKAIESRDSRMLTDEFLFAQHRQILEIMRYLLIDRLNAPDVLHHLFRKGVITEQEKEIVLQEERKKTMNIFIVDELFTKGEAEFEAFKYILRLNEDHEALADILEVLETVFKTLEKHNPNKPLDPEVDSGTEADVDPLEEDPYELVGEVLRAHHSQPPALDAAHMHCDISYYDRETGEVLPIITLPTPPGYFPRLTSCDNPRASVALAREFTDMIEQNLQMDGCLTDSCESPEKYVPVISLDIYDQNLGDDGASVLASVLEKYGCVSELSIPKNCIDSDGMERLASALQVNKCLLKLDVRMNPMTNEAARAFSNALHKNTSLKSLNLTDTRISHDGCSDIVQNLVGNGTLRELDLGFNELDDRDCDHIAQLLGNRSALKKLRLRGNNIAFLGCRALSRALERNTGLLVLDLSSNDIGDNAAFHIGTMLSRNTTLQFLNLEKCGFTKEAAGAIAQSLTENKTLLSLDLGMNHLGDSGAEALAAMLSHNNSLKTLCLNMCGIGKQGFLDLLEALDNNTCLSTLKLCFNEIGRSERRAPMSQLHPHDGGIQGNTAILDLVYDRLHSTLVYKRDLKLLLWGNKLDEKRYSKEVRFEK
ncbi:uncharacterized protein LOC106162433 [Lingula anatina]|uniref:Uncharacterized protein LOC106162433 n=1 Tax=Lingula anatina TaxID=7574 RepID=A0A1S3IA88_LINAN|nr:uncharacterized protein LOC106162433 [Lingula anatina]|eukprot:XP_013395180.1 uncharacterized protein LOC106162433 [Lingula anatina]